MTLSLADEERGSTEFDNYGTDHQGDAMVGNDVFFYFLPPRLERSS